MDTRFGSTQGIQNPSGATLLVATVEAIARWIVTGKVPVGGIIPSETEIVEELGVSRTVVREAVRTLVAKGMLRTRRRLGTEVTPIQSWSLLDRSVVAWRIRYDPDPRLIDELLDFVTGIELFTIERCALSQTVDADSLYQAIERLEWVDRAKPADVLEADAEFQRCLMRGSDNQFSQHVQPMVLAAFSAVTFADTVDELEHREGLSMRRSLVEAVVSGDAVLAREVVERLASARRRHVHAGLARLRG